MNPLIRLALAATLTLGASAAEWTIPVAGNTYRTAPEPGRLQLDREGALSWPEAAEACTIYFRIDRPATLGLSLDASGAGEEVELRIDGRTLTTSLAEGGFTDHPLEPVEVPRAGYVAVSLMGRDDRGSSRIRALKVTSETEGLALDFVKSNQGNMFYWGRRGPSVHLSYPLPRDHRIEYAYSEITVPEGEDPIGSYFMANGFGQGYFGIQVKSPTERWVLFSVWSPFRTDNPREIPEDQRVATLASGPDVVARDFGGEGSGGQSFLRYPWKAGTTYAFLTRVRPDGEGSTIYTGWFAEKGGDWRLIASFRRPKTDTWLTGFHSFLENFSADRGHLGRRSFHGNQWVRDNEGVWHELTRARFTGDATARGRHRLDYAGGVEDGRFFIRNGGFFDEPTPLDSWFEREPTPELKPEIDVGSLPRS